MSQDEEWRQFEKLAARIEAVLAPRGAMVRSPDRLPDLLTGQTREVDASIRMAVGSVQILITVECRRRDAVQDDTWIEQLATKREKLGAARTIAVSASGFSEPAKITAKLKGIDLRDLKEITDEEIVSWIRSVLLTKIGLHVRLKSVKVTLQDDPADEHELTRDPAGGVRSLVRAADDAFVSPYDVLNLLVRTSPDLLQRIPLDGTKQPWLLRGDLPEGAMRAYVGGVSVPISSISFEIDCSYEISRERLSDGKYYEYAGPDGAILHVAQFETKLGSLPAILEVHAAPQKKPPGSS